MADRHTFERERGALYYEEAAYQAATFLHTALLLRPFADYNLVIGWARASQYMHVSGQPLQARTTSCTSSPRRSVLRKPICVRSRSG